MSQDKNMLEKLGDLLYIPLAISMLLGLFGGLSYYSYHSMKESGELRFKSRLIERARLVGVHNDINKIQAISSSWDFDKDGFYDVDILYKDGRTIRHYGLDFKRKEDVSERIYWWHHELTVNPETLKRE